MENMMCTYMSMIFDTFEILHIRCITDEPLATIGVDILVVKVSNTDSEADTNTQQHGISNNPKN